MKRLLAVFPFYFLFSGAASMVIGAWFLATGYGLWLPIFDVVGGAAVTLIWLDIMTGKHAWRRRLVCAFRGHERTVETQAFGGATILYQVRLGCAGCNDWTVLNLSMQNNDGVMYEVQEMEEP